jgi:small conductance mechanosensitive channel
VLPTGSFVDDLFRLPGLRDLPFQSTLRQAAALLLLFILFAVLRGIIVRVVQKATERVAARRADPNDHGHAARIRTIGTLAASVALYVLGFIFAVSALTVIGFPVASLIASAGIAGIAVGFGAQKLVRDLFTGFFILLEDQYAVGDYITVNGVTGVVEEFALRTTRIRDDDGKLYILSNGDIGQVCNQSRGPVAGGFDIAIAAGADLAKATEVLNKALADKSQEIGLADPARVRGVSAVEAAKTTLSVGFRAGVGTRPGGAAYQLREAARDALVAAEIPLG